MLLFVVARSRLDRYEVLRRQFHDWRDVRIVLDRREGERRTPQPIFADSTDAGWSAAGLILGLTRS